MMNENMLDVSPSAFCVENNIVWGVHATLNYLFSYDLSTGFVEIYDIYPHSIIGRESSFIGICKYENYVYLVPCWSSKLISYNIEKKTIKVVEDGSSSKGRFGKSFVIEDKLYCIPMYEDFFMIVDLKKGCIERKIPWKHMMANKESVIMDSFLFDNKIVCLVKDCLEDVLLLDYNCDITRRAIQNNGEQLITGCSSKENMFLCSPKTGMIFQYDKNFSFQKSIRVKGTSFATLNFMNNMLILDNIEKAEKSIYFIENEQEKIINSQVKKTPLSYTGMHGIFYYSNGLTYYFDRAKNELYVVDKNNKYETFRIEINKKMADDIIKNNITKEGLILERYYTNLGFFIESIIGEST